MRKPLGVMVGRRRLVSSLQAGLAERETALASMTPALQAVCAEVVEQLTGQAENSLRFYHQLGQIVLRVEAAPETYLTPEQQTAGTSPLTLLKTAISTGYETLRKSAQFARMYPAEQLEALLARRAEALPEFRLTWGHLVSLITIANDADRLEAEDLVLTNLWSPDELRDYILRRLHRPTRTGRPLAIPRTLAAGLRQICQVSRLWVDRAEKVWNGASHSVFNNLLGLEPDKVTDDVLQDAEAVLETLHTLRDRAGELVTVAESTVKRLRGQPAASRAGSRKAALVAAAGKKTATGKASKGRRPAGKRPGKKK